MERNDIYKRADVLGLRAVRQNQGDGNRWSFVLPSGREVAAGKTTAAASWLDGFAECYDEHGRLARKFDTGGLNREGLTWEEWCGAAGGWRCARTR